MNAATAERLSKAHSAREATRREHPAEFDAGAQAGLHGEQGYPGDFQAWSEDRRNAYFAGVSSGRLRRASADGAGNGDARDQKRPKTYPVADHPTKQKATVKLLKCADIAPAAIEWIWRDFLARGKLHILAGSPGAGKTTIAVSFMATISAGGIWPDGTRARRGNVLIWSGEDDPADTLVPRLIAAGADVDHVYAVGPVSDQDGNRPFDPGKDMEALEAQIDSIGGVDLIVVDPITSAITGDSHKNSEVRRALQVFVDIAAKTGAAVLGVTHLTKATAGRDPLERLTGSLAFGALPRVVFIAAKDADPEDGEKAKRYLTRAKSNIGPDGGGFEYEVVTAAMPGDDRIVTSSITFGAALDGTARQILATADTVRDEDNSALADAKEFLSDFLEAGPRSSKDCKAAARDACIADRTLRRAKSVLKFPHFKPAGSMTAEWYWCLPEHLPDEGGQEGGHTHRFGQHRADQSLSQKDFGQHRRRPKSFEEEL